VGRLRGDHLDLSGLRGDERPGKPVSIDKTKKKEFIYYLWLSDIVYGFLCFTHINVEAPFILDLAADRDKTRKI